MLANEYHRPVKKRTVQFAAIQQELPLQGFVNYGHTPASFHQFVRRLNDLLRSQSVLLIEVLGDVG
jgi:hypothetical protein